MLSINTYRSITDFWTRLLASVGTRTAQLGQSKLDKMNKIAAILDRSDYEGYHDFINFRIDDFWLDEKLEELYLGNMYKGLIPTLLPWLDRKEERKIVWKRILPDINSIAVCPILMCPDDCDFSCTLIVAEIVNYGPFVQWKKLGVDITRQWEADKVGSVVEWFDRFPELNFECNDYQTMLDAFKIDFEHSQ